MERLVECVPNISEGADSKTIAALADALGGVTGARLLDQTSDADHARSVFTLAGPLDAVSTALEAGMAVAIERIDMRRQTGQHPRIGAVDVVPFVPIGDTPMSDVVAGSRAFAQRIAKRFELPVFLYAHAAHRPDRRVLADIRRPGFEGLAAALAVPGGEPDFGPGLPHPTAGATAVGARPFLIAWNIQLEGDDLRAARRIAAKVRERDGGLPGVQALGLELPALGCIQVSMNILDHRRTPLWRVWEAVSRSATEQGLTVIDSELIGLLPAAALDDVADHLDVAVSASIADRHQAAGDWLRIRGFSATMTVEARLAGPP